MMWQMQKRIPMLKSVKEFAESEHAEVIVISARAEEEIAELDDEDKAEFLEALGIEESGFRSTDSCGL